jgi:hypothetical protein
VDKRLDFFFFSLFSALALVHESFVMVHFDGTSGTQSKFIPKTGSMIMLYCIGTACEY